VFVEALSSRRASSNGAAQTSPAAATKAQIDEAHSLDARPAAAGVDEAVVDVPVLETPSHPATHTATMTIGRMNRLTN
jgi:hypothetical protein